MWCFFSSFALWLKARRVLTLFLLAMPSNANKIKQQQSSKNLPPRQRHQRWGLAPVYFRSFCVGCITLPMGWPGGKKGPKFRKSHRRSSKVRLWPLLLMKLCFSYPPIYLHLTSRLELSAFRITSEILNALSFVGQIPRLSKVNLFTLLSLWMELFPGVEAQGQKSQV